MKIVTRNCKRGTPHPEKHWLFLWTRIKGVNVWVTKNDLLKRRTQAAESYRKYRSKRLAYAKKYRADNPMKIYLIGKRWNEKNAEHSRRWRANYRRNRARIDPVFRIRNLVARRVSLILKAQNIRKSNSTLSILGCSPIKLKKHLEKQFQPGMHWGNHGRPNHCWHIDHIMPVGIARTTKDVMRLFHYTNLQPLWGWQNRAKSDKITA